MTELERFVKTIPREHWSGFYLYYERYCKGKPYKTAWYFYKKEFYNQEKRERERRQIITRKIGANYD